MGPDNKIIFIAVDVSTMSHPELPPTHHGQIGSRIFAGLRFSSVYRNSFCSSHLRFPTEEDLEAGRRETATKDQRSATSWQTGKVGQIGKIFMIIRIEFKSYGLISKLAKGAK